MRSSRWRSIGSNLELLTRYTLLARKAQATPAFGLTMEISAASGSDEKSREISEALGHGEAEAKSDEAHG